jgi:hypothetical protein
MLLMMPFDKPASCLLFEEERERERDQSELRVKTDRRKEDR